MSCGIAERILRDFGAIGREYSASRLRRSFTRMRIVLLVPFLALAIGCGDEPCPEPHESFAVDGTLTSTESAAYAAYRKSSDASFGIPTSDDRVVTTGQPQVDLMPYPQCTILKEAPCMAIRSGPLLLELVKPKETGTYDVKHLGAIACEADGSCVAPTGTLVVDDVRPRCSDPEQACGRFDARLHLEPMAASDSAEVHGDLTIAWHQSAIERTCHSSFGAWPMPMQ